MLKYILLVIPTHDTYIEPFAGGLAVFLAKARVKVEVINDLNDEVSGFYLYVREHLDSLLSEMVLALRGNFQPPAREQGAYGTSKGCALVSFKSVVI